MVISFTTSTVTPEQGRQVEEFLGAFLPRLKAEQGEVCLALARSSSLADRRSCERVGFYAAVSARARAWRRYRPGASPRWRLNARENEYSDR